MANWAGVGATLAALVRPSVLQPRLRVPSIAHLDWARLRAEGNVQGVVIDKDNCIARPRDDDLAPSPELHRAWDSLLREFGPDKVLVVSNSAGDLRKDPLLLQAESLSRNLRVPVLVHAAPKPAHACARQVAAHFLAPRAEPAQPGEARQGQVVYSPLACALAPPPSSLPTPRRGPTRLLVIGDRLATDMILAHRLSSLRLPLSLPSARSSSLLSYFRRSSATRIGAEGDRIDAVPVLTTHLWAREGAGTTLLRAVERAALWGLRARGRRRARRVEQDDGERWERFVRGYAEERRIERGEEPAVAVQASASAPPSRPPPSASPAAPVPAPALSLPSLATLQALPSRLYTSLSTLPARTSTFLAALPARLSASLATLPPRALSALQRTASRLASRAEARLPVLLARLAAPEGALARVVRIYARPGEIAPPPTGALRREPDAEVGLVERVERSTAVRRAQGLWSEARARAEEGRSAFEGLRARVEELRGRLPRREKAQ
ncbi:hypothetical protein JCM10449v2_007507 [Rhodotorula kratochvilovae]